MNTIMDAKEENILKHYRRIIEKRVFDEYDVLGFLIFVRRHLDNNEYPCIVEYCDLMAHRQRNQGRTMQSIEQAIENNYEPIPGSKKVKGYHGITKAMWEDEWSRLGEMFQISMSKEIIKELVLCIFSLAQFTCYLSPKGKGNVSLRQVNDGMLALVTTEGKPDSLYVCFSVFGPYVFLHEYIGGVIDVVVETKRVGKEIRLYAGDTRII